MYSTQWDMSFCLVCFGPVIVRGSIKTERKKNCAAVCCISFHLFSFNLFRSSLFEGGTLAFSSHYVPKLSCFLSIFGLFTSACTSVPALSCHLHSGPRETCYWGVPLPGVDEPGAPVDGLAASPAPSDGGRIHKAPGQMLHLQTVSHQGLQVGAAALWSNDTNGWKNLVFSPHYCSMSDSLTMLCPPGLVEWLAIFTLLLLTYLLLFFYLIF